MNNRFLNRREAGRLLAERLRSYTGRSDVIILALPRGGVPVAYEVAMALRVPLDVFLVRKLGVPGHEELAMGAIASGGTRVLDYEAIDRLAISAQSVEAVTHREQLELERRERAFRGERPPPVVEGKTVIVVDDGLATGSTMRAAIAALRARLPREIIAAAPVGSIDTCEIMDGIADRCICHTAVFTLDGVGMWYEDFSQTQDAEVITLLADAERRARGAVPLTLL